MDSSENVKNPNEQVDSFDDEDLIDKLPKDKHWESVEIYQWRGYWFIPEMIKSTLALPSHFHPRDDDILLASSLKVGTTWLKSLCTNIMHKQDVLTKVSPHMHIPTIESMIFVNDPFALLSKIPSPRIVHTHLPYTLLSDSIKNSKCKIVYITRNPKDTFISLWHHSNNTVDGIIIKKPLSLEKAFEYFCNGVYIQGPFFDHVLEYYLESLKIPNKILFLRYEDLQRNPKGEVKKLALFLGRPFCLESEVDQVLGNCSLERLKNLEVNKIGRNKYNGLPNAVYFRKGIIGDSRNYLTQEMEERLDEIMRVKFQGTGLDLSLDA
ncbi:hypothetical protein M9H77_25423 [Catharanthus roseus]|uniref:Uncharacterized protein n=1 Tax=Catharanthus roseus TaxID=4058 RepID=A0ACC0A8P7_CATRO|nr:hypothetical protein M9H77_25423 [Catharanthus roseus]